MLLRLLRNLLPRATQPASSVPADEDPSRQQWRTHMRMAQAALPGPDYLALMAQIHRLLKPRTYVEIGVDTGRSLALVAPETQVLGVDPAPKVERTPPNVRIYALTSDEFFARIDVQREFGGRPVELAFIDGMHRFEFALRDFIAIERLATAQSTVLVHDTYPLNRETATRERSTRFWSGDIWRLVVALKKYRPDLAVHTIATMPTGLTVVRGLNPASEVLAANLDEIIAEFTALDYSVLDEDKPATLNLVPNTPQQLKSLLA